MSEVDIKEDEPRSVARAIAALRRFSRVAEKKIARAVERARTKHKYKNRTGDMEASTQMTSLSSGRGEFQIGASVGVEYASYVAERGFSSFDQNMKRAVDEISEALSKMSD